jgi:hypothetical protein
MTDHDHISRGFDGYLRFNFYRTEGYMGRLDALVFRKLIAGQPIRESKGR